LPLKLILLEEVGALVDPPKVTAQVWVPGSPTWLKVAVYLIALKTEVKVPAPFMVALVAASVAFPIFMFAVLEVHFENVETIGLVAVMAEIAITDPALKKPLVRSMGLVDPQL